MDSSSIRVLIVDDEPAHAESIRRAFSQSGFGDEVRVAATLHEYRAAIAETTPDIVIMDINLPDGSAFDVLTAPTESAPFPVVVMTSYGNETVAVQAMKAGAVDYVVKSAEAFSGMPRTAERALREWRLLKQQRKSEEALKESHEQLRAYFTLPLIGIAKTNLEQGWLDLNARLCSMLGYSETELRTKSLVDLTPEGYDPPEAHLYAEYLHDKITLPFVYERAYLKKDGSILHALAATDVLRNEDGSVASFVSFLQDITDRKQAEEKIALQLKELEKWYQVTLNREGRVQELKDEVNGLLEKLGRQPKYGLRDE